MGKNFPTGTGYFLVIDIQCIKFSGMPVALEAV
jgi:hypothetical protein